MCKNEFSEVYMTMIKLLNAQFVYRSAVVKHVGVFRLENTFYGYSKLC